MAIRAHATETQLWLQNINRTNANPPIVFPGVNATNQFAFAIWARADNLIPANLWGYAGTNGSLINLYHDGVYWQIRFRDVGVARENRILAPVTVGQWVVFCIDKDGPAFHVYYGIEDPIDTSPWLRPVTLVHVHSFLTESLNFEFDRFVIASTSMLAVSNFKFWNTSIPINFMQEQVNKWDALPGPSGGPAPFWCSTLRTPGDLSNIANPSSSHFWNENYQYSLIHPANNFEFVSDPAYMANATPCPTWLYPNGFSHSFINPGLTPLVETTYKAPQYFDFLDLGSITSLDHQFVKAVFYGITFGSGVGVGARDTWASYKDENGAFVEPNFSDPAQRFQQDTGVDAPVALKPTNIYLWKFGAQFTWAAQTPQVATDTSQLAHFRLLVTYLGYPRVVPGLPVIDLAGLFAINKGGPAVDRYNRGVELKIPDPTIKTAYIGE